MLVGEHDIYDNKVDSGKWIRFDHSDSKVILCDIFLDICLFNDELVMQIYFGYMLIRLIIVLINHIEIFVTKLNQIGLR